LLKAKTKTNLKTTLSVAVIAHGIGKAAKLLQRSLLVITNVPYLGRGKQDDVLRNCEHPPSQG
jgi:ABC-type phosphonate transport system ATPase subunit